MRTKLTKVRLEVTGPLLFYLFVFLLWFPVWLHAPRSLSARLLGLVFGAMTAALAAFCVVGSLPWSWRFAEIVIHVYETYLKRESGETPVAPSKRMTQFASMDRPPLVITKRRKDGTPICAACPICEFEFSTEAFDGDRSYPHESKLEQWYGEHFEDHLSDESE